MNGVRKKGITKSFFVSFQTNGLNNRHCCQVARILIGRKIHKNSLSCLYGNFYSRNHITICRNNDGDITIFLISISNNLSGNAHISFFFLVGVNDISTIETGD